MYWNNKVAAIGTSCIMLWYGRDIYSCTCSRFNEPSEHFFRLCEHQKVFMKISWARKLVFASQSQEGRSRRIFCIWFWGSEGYLFHCSYGSFFVLSNDVKRCTPHWIRARCTFGLAHQISILFYVQSHTVFLKAMLILKTSSFVFPHPHSLQKTRTCQMIPGNLSCPPILWIHNLTSANFIPIYFPKLQTEEREMPLYIEIQIHLAFLTL